MSDPTIQSLAAEIEALLQRVNAHANDINRLGEQSRSFDSRFTVLESGKFLDRITFQRNGIILLKNENGQDTVVLQGTGGVILVRSDDGEPAILLQGNAIVEVGREGTAGLIAAKNDKGENTVKIFGSVGQVEALRFVTSSADCAEQFDVADDAAAEPGTVMVIGADSKLEPCRMAYDSRVAGVISGAGNLKTAFLLNHQSHALNNQAGRRAALALMGSVYCKCDAGYAPIAAGDLLTTSVTVGHAMRAVDADKKIGTIVGKALAPLSSGTGLMPILVAPR